MAVADWQQPHSLHTWGSASSTPGQYFNLKPLAIVERPQKVEDKDTTEAMPKPHREAPLIPLRTFNIDIAAGIAQQERHLQGRRLYADPWVPRLAGAQLKGGDTGVRKQIVYSDYLTTRPRFETHKKH